MLFARMLVVVMMFAALTTEGLTQSAPNFSGTWTRDWAKTLQGIGGNGSRTAPELILTIVQDAKTFAIKTNQDNPPFYTVTYRLDGTPSTFEILDPKGGGMSVPTNAKWNGAKLVTEMLQGTMPITGSITWYMEGEMLVGEAPTRGGAGFKTYFKRTP